jgi:ATP-binding cassette, subfamily B, bacterial HlyB/CyaB
MREELGTDKIPAIAQNGAASHHIPSVEAVKAAVAAFLAPYIEDSRRLDDWVAKFQIQTMALGDELVSRSLSEKRLWIVGVGRVRLVCRDLQQQREVSASVVEAGDWFGVAGLFGAAAGLSYRAIAATGGHVALLEERHLQELLNSTPKLQTYLQTQLPQQARLRFLKTQTDLGRKPIALAIEQIEQVLPLTQIITVKASAALSQTPVTQPGLYWLDRGEMTGNQAPMMGQCWLQSETQESWSATTDLQITCLPEANWAEAVAIAPGLASRLAIPVTEQPKRTSRKPSAILGNPLSRTTAPQAEVPASAQPPTAPQNNIIDFPSPTKRRRFSLHLLRSKPFIQQQSSSDCGITCLSMVSQYWGKRYPIHLLREMAQVGRAGTTLKNLAATAEKLGFQTRPVRASLNRMAEQKNPWIAHWQGDHYIVVYQVKAKSVLVADPATGKHWVKKAEFAAGWTNYALLLEPGQQLRQVEDKEGKTLGAFWQVLLRYKSLMLQIVLLSFLLQVFGLITPLFTQVILDQVVAQKSMPALNIFTIGLVLFSIWRVGLDAVRQYLLDYFSNRLDLTLVSGFISHSLRLPLKFFEDRNVGDIITRIQENGKIQQFLIRQAVATWLDASMGLVYLGLMLYYNWQLTVFVLATLVPIIILTLASTPVMKKLSREIFKASSEQNSQVVEMFSGISTIKSTASEQEVRWRWEDKVVNLLNVQFRGQKVANGLGVTSGLINAVTGAALLWFGASLVIKGELTIGQFVAFNMLIGNVTGPLMSLVGLWDELQEVLISVERLNDVFAAKPEEIPGEPMMTLPPIEGEVCFDKVSFSYDGDDDLPTLQNLSFRTAPGETIAIVGRSGSGKSTLIKLLQGLYHPTRGRILTDGHDIRHISPHSLRSQQGVVPQECFLFSGTILDNIRMHHPDATLEEVVEVAKLAEAHSFIQDLPLGYNTKVGERGANVSGGQRQRIAIARALLGDPNMLILDEATSSLDTESERRFQQNLERISRDRTTFIIAHRLSTVQHADRILVLDRGILVEQGQHHELLQAQGLYYHLAQQQLNI